MAIEEKDMKQKQNASNMIDQLGAHTYERTDMEGVFHTDWY
ncbi:hypothetical protein DT075_05085 [Bacillus licheniformis]|nr:hypothetical protein DT075_05085 [Bacillus licheniformis]